MIVDRIENAGLYCGRSERIARGFELLKERQLADKPNGRYDVDGDSLFYLAQRYTTQPPAERRFESHRKYADIQLILSGREVMGNTPVSGLTVSTPYDEAKDIVFYNTPQSYSTVEVSEGMFALFFPGEAHMAACQLGAPTDVHKIVVKVRMGGE